MPGTFDEGKHPRAGDGKFGSGSGQPKPAAPAKPAPAAAPAKVTHATAGEGTILKSHGGGVHTVQFKGGSMVVHESQIKRQPAPATAAPAAPAPTATYGGEGQHVERRPSWPVDRPPNTAQVLKSGQTPGQAPATAPKPGPTSAMRTTGAAPARAQVPATAKGRDAAATKHLGHGAMQIHKIEHDGSPDGPRTIHGTIHGHQFSAKVYHDPSSHGVGRDGGHISKLHIRDEHGNVHFNWDRGHAGGASGTGRKLAALLAHKTQGLHTHAFPAAQGAKAASSATPKPAKP